MTVTVVVLAVFLVGYLLLESKRKADLKAQLNRSPEERAEDARKAEEMFGPNPASQRAQHERELRRAEPWREDGEAGDST
ncbi:MAG: hypothetical protein AAGF91_07400 [Actinomycetota bacterium]